VLSTTQQVEALRHPLDVHAEPLRVDAVAVVPDDRGDRSLEGAQGVPCGDDVLLLTHAPETTRRGQASATRTTGRMSG
jgi:hypothetical protein